MEESLLNVVLHPVRMKIIQYLAVGGSLTAQQIGEQLEGIPQATMYRHLNKLLEAGIVEVVKENRVRGTVEKVFSISAKTMEKAGQQVLSASPQEQMNYFFSFLMTLFSEFQRYISRPEHDMVKDGLSYTTSSLYLSDEEFMEFAKEISAAFIKVINNKPSPERKPRTVATIIIPD